MCGPSAQEQAITQEQADFYKQLQSEYATTFGANQQILGALTSSFQPILQAGPSQTGFAPGEETALQTQNTENVATDYAQAQRATAQQLASRGGGNTFLPSSVTANLLAQNANQAANARATGQRQITMQNYQQGYQNWQQAANVLGNTASQYNPTGYAGLATNAGSQAMSSANMMQQQAFAPWSIAGGVLGSVGGAATARFLH